MKRFVAIFLLGCSCFLAGAFPDKPAVEGPVNDYAGIFSSEQVLRLQHMLVDFADSTSNQICVVTVNDLEGMDVGQYAIEIGLKWKVGSDDFNNGVVLLVKPKIGDSYGEAFIAVGRGLEGAIPDIICHRIINEIAVPYFRNGDYYGGVQASCLKIMELADSEYHSPYEEEDELAVFLAFIFIAILVIIVISIAADKDNKGRGGNGGHSGGGGRPIVFINPGNGGTTFGGFSGGGSFGGGFSGGFGGGSFGGGGGGGRW